MDKLIINVPGAPASEVELKPRVNRFGRSLNSDFPISHPSVSSAHCEIVAADGAWTSKTSAPPMEPCSMESRCGKVPGNGNKFFAWAKWK